MSGLPGAHKELLLRLFPGEGETAGAAAFF